MVRQRDQPREHRGRAVRRRGDSSAGPMVQRAPAVHRGDEAEEDGGAERVERVAAREQRGRARATPRRAAGQGRRCRAPRARGRPSRARSASVPESAASGITVKIGLSAKTGPTIEMSPRALARARSPLIPITSTAQTATAGQAKRGSANGVAGDEEEHRPARARHGLRPGDDHERGDAARPALHDGELGGLGQRRAERQREPGQTSSTRATPLASSAAAIAATSSAEGGSTGGRTSALRNSPRRAMPSFIRACASPDGSPAP